MKLLVSIIIIVLVICLAIFLYSWYRLHTKVNLHTQSAQRSIPSNLKPQTSFVTNRDGQKIAYWYFPVENPKAIVILIHGYDNPGGKSQMLIHSEYLNKSGYSTVLLDLRSYGESEGDKMFLGVNEWKDVESVYDHIKSLPESKNKKIGFFGVSMGGTVALNTVGQTGKGDFVIASVPYADFDSLFHFQIKAAGFPAPIFYPFMKLAAYIELGKDYEHFTPTQVMKNIKVPIFLISAKRDEVVNSEDAKRLYGLANEPKEYWEADSGHDVFDAHPEEFKQKILVFLSLLSESN